jgi:aminomethyltransferase
MNPGIYHLALRDLHKAAGATFIQQSGWSLPADYGDPEAEYRALREAAAVMDHSHRSRFIVSGTDSREVLAATFSGHIAELEEGRAMRAATLAGGLIDDLVLIARTGGINYVVAGEPDRRAATLQRLNDARGPGFDARIDDRTESTCWIALAGPATARIAATAFGEAMGPRLRFMQTAAFEFHGFRALAVRTSGVGEDGFELMVAPAVAQHLLATLGEMDVPLAGAAAHAVARIEACVPAFDPDLAPGLTPGEAGLAELLGLAIETPHRVLAAFVLDGAEPVEAGQHALCAGRVVGEVRSCVYSAGLGVTIGLAILESAQAVPGTELLVAGRRGAVAAKPLFRRREQP